MYFIVMPKVNLIVILMTYVCYLYSINCPTVICLLSMCYLSYGETQLVNCGSRSNFLYIVIPFYFYSHCLLYLHTIILLPLDTLNPLFTANRWDWQPHRKLGAKFLVMLCAGFTLLLVESYTPTSSFIWRPCPECHEASKHHLLKFVFLLLVRFNLGFITEGRLAAVLIIPSSWGSQRALLTSHHRPETNWDWANWVTRLFSIHTKPHLVWLIFTFEFIRCPLPPILSPSSRTFAKLTLIKEQDLQQPQLHQHYLHQDMRPLLALQGLQGVRRCLPGWRGTWQPAESMRTVLRS
jgi:hypothetical protein